MITHYLQSLWSCPGMSDHNHLKQPTNICCFHIALVTSKNSASYSNLFVRYCTLKNTAFWLVLRFLAHNSRTRFFPNVLFLQDVIFVLKQKAYLHGKYFCQNSKNLIFGSFLGFLEPSEPIQFFWKKTRFITFLTLWCLSTWKKYHKKLILGSLAFQKERQTKPNL